VKFSVPAVNRKCHSGRIDGGFRVIKTWLGVSLALVAADVVRAGEVPLPRPRPLRPATTLAAPPPADAATPRAASACRLALGEAVALAPSVAPVAGPGDCGGDDLVRLEAVVLADSRRVALDPPALLRCEMAAAVAAWVRDDVAPLVEQGARLAAIEVADSFSCRGRNRVAGAKLSEHGRANAIDIRALRLTGAVLTLPDRATPRALRVQLMAAMCSRFTTVLGPGSDGFHEDHIHLDRRERRNGYRICQWTIEDEASPPPPEAGVVATVPLPRPRPASVRQARQLSQ
jgi:hypothetical protein